MKLDEMEKRHGQSKNVEDRRGQPFKKDQSRVGDDRATNVGKALTDKEFSLKKFRRRFDGEE